MTIEIYLLIMKVQVCQSSVGVLLGDEFGFRKQKISCEYYIEWNS